MYSPTAAAWSRTMRPGAGGQTAAAEKPGWGARMAFLWARRQRGGRRGERGVRGVEEGRSEDSARADGGRSLCLREVAEGAGGGAGRRREHMPLVLRDDLLAITITSIASILCPLLRQRAPLPSPSLTCARHPPTHCPLPPAAAHPRSRAYAPASVQSVQNEDSDCPLATLQCGISADAQRAEARSRALRRRRQQLIIIEHSRLIRRTGRIVVSCRGGRASG